MVPLCNYNVTNAYKVCKFIFKLLTSLFLLPFNVISDITPWFNMNAHLKFETVLQIFVGLTWKLRVYVGGLFIKLNVSIVLHGYEKSHD